MSGSQRPAQPDVTLSIVIVNYRSWDCLERCLASLQTQQAVTREITVVDNDSDDGRLPEFAGRFPDVTFVVNSANLGFASACNLGAHHARGELLLFVNPDVRAEPGQLERLVREKRRHPEVRILTASQTDERGRPQKAFDAFPTLASTVPGVRALRRALAPRRYPHPRRPHKELVRCDWVSGAVLLIDVADFRELGGWSDRYWMYHEDVDLCRRAHDRGWVIACTPHAVLIHEHGGSTRRDAEVEVVTRCETVISRHVYISRHHSGLYAAAFHSLVALERLAQLTVIRLFDLLTLHRIPTLHRRGRVWGELVAYYARRPRAGSWISPRSPRHPARREASGSGRDGVAAR